MISGAIFYGLNNGLGNAGDLFQSGLNFAKFNPKTAQLDLSIVSSEVDQISIG